MARQKGMGDIPGRDIDPHQPRYDQEHGWPGGQREKAPPAQGSAPFVRQPNWVEPPQESQTLDIYTNPTVTLAVATANQTVLLYNVPEGGIAVLNAFGNDLENAGAWPQVTWRFLWKTDVYFPKTSWFAGATQTWSWRNFQRSLGNPRDPTIWKRPIVLKGPGQFILQADNADIIQHLADARFLGWEWIPGKSTTSGDIGPEFMR